MNEIIGIITIHPPIMVLLVVPVVEANPNTQRRSRKPLLAGIRVTQTRLAGILECLEYLAARPSSFADEAVALLMPMVVPPTR